MTGERPQVLHVQPHPGGGAERVVTLLRRIEAYDHARVYLSHSRGPMAALPTLAGRRPDLARRAARSDVLHVVGDTGAILTTRLLGRRPSIFATHGLSMLRRSRGARLTAVRSALRTVLRNAGCTVCSSEAERAELQELAGPRAGRFVVVPNGLDLPAEIDPEVRAATREELDVAPDELACLLLGRLDPFKDPLTAVTAAATARAGGAPVCLLVAGEGPLEGQVAGLAGEAVRPLGYRNDPERLMAAADVFVLPSLREGQSFALLEAMGHGLPVITSDGAGIPETVGNAGIVVRAGDSAALAAGLTRLAGDEPRRRKLGEAARSRVAETFPAERQVEAMHEVFDAVRRAGPVAA